MAPFEHVEEYRTTPSVVIVAGRPIFERIAFVGVDIVPAKSTTFENRMQRVDKDKAARQIQARGTALLAEATDQVILGQPGEALACQPVHQPKAGGKLHGRD